MPSRPAVLCSKCNRSMARHCPVKVCVWLFCEACDMLYNKETKMYLPPVA